MASRAEAPSGETKKSAKPAEEAISPTAEFLSHPILSPDTGLTEVQTFLESRIPAMPSPKDATSWQKQADKWREMVLDRVVFRGKASLWRNAITRVEWLDTLEGGPGYKIRKLRYEALPDLWIPALLYEPDQLSGKVPVVLNVNGHDSLGKAAPYKQIRCINQAKRGMLALNVEWFGMGQLRGEMGEHYRMNQLDLCGTSGLAPYYLAMKRGLDVLLALEHADPQRVAVTGLSGGGWQTIFISSLDTRVTLCNPVAGYSSFLTRVHFLSDLGDSEQTPSDLATVADYKQLTAMLAPRPALLTFNAKDDCCFGADHALPPLLEAAGPIYKLFGKPDNLRSHINQDPGTHNFEKDNRQQLYRMIGDHFYAGQSDFKAEEIPSDNEVKTAEQLQVSMPPENANFHSLASQLAKNLPQDPGLPSDSFSAKRWQQTRRSMLHEIIRSRNYQVQSEKVGAEEKNGIKANFWKLKLGGVWTVPAIELFRGEPTDTVVMVADDGRISLAEQADRLLAADCRVIAIDPFYLGESRIKERAHLFAMTVAAVGDRPLGIQTSQIIAVARWAQTELQSNPARVVAQGPRTSLAALIAASLDENAIAGVELHQALGSLKEIVEQNWSVDQKPELFCFGLLEKFDIKQLTALAAPRPVIFVKPSQRLKSELAEMKHWYPLFGGNFQDLD